MDNKSTNEEETSNTLNVILIGAVIVLILIIAPVIYCLFCRKAEARMKFGEHESYFDASEMSDTTPAKDKDQYRRRNKSKDIETSPVPSPRAMTPDGKV